MKTTILIAALSLLLTPANAATFKAQVIPMSVAPKHAHSYKVAFCHYNAEAKTRHQAFESCTVTECRGDGSESHIVAPTLQLQGHWTIPYGFLPDGSVLIGNYWQSDTEAAKENATQKVYPSCNHGEVYSAGKSIICLTKSAPGSYHSSPSANNSGIAFRTAFGDTTYLYQRSNDGKFTKLGGDSGYGAQVSVLGDSAYHHPDSQGNYTLVINGKETQTGQLWNFVAAWSPDGKHLLFVAGAYNHKSDIWICNRDGSNAHEIATRNGYIGVSRMFTTDLWHTDSSNLPCWTPDGLSVIYTANEGQSDELYKVDVASGDITQLTSSPKGSSWAHPHFSRDGKLMVVTGTLNGQRNIYATDFKTMWQVTRYRAPDSAGWSYAD